MSIINYTIDTDTADLSKYETRLILWALGVKLEWSAPTENRWVPIEDVEDVEGDWATYKIAK